MYVLHRLGDLGREIELLLDATHHLLFNGALGH